MNVWLLYSSWGATLRHPLEIHKVAAPVRPLPHNLPCGQVDTQHCFWVRRPVCVIESRDEEDSVRPNKSSVNLAVALLSRALRFAHVAAFAFHDRSEDILGSDGVNSDACGRRLSGRQINDPNEGPPRNRCAGREVADRSLSSSNAASVSASHDRPCVVADADGCRKRGRGSETHVGFARLGVGDEVVH